MADQIKKIIFTTKESYDQKVVAGTLDSDAIYAIDASQAVTPTEVKTAVDNGFDKFGLTLGIDETKANFYDLPISLADMIKDIVKDKVDANYTNDSSLLVVNGKTVKIPAVFRNTVVTVKQNGTDFGMLKYTLNPTIEEDGSESTPRIATIELPAGVDVTKEFEVVLANVFGTKTHTVNFTPTFEKIVKNKLDEVVGRFYFNETPNVYVSDNPYGDLGNFDYQVKYFENTDEGKQYFRNNLDSVFSSFGLAFVAIPDKSLIDSAVLKRLQDLASYGNYFLITNLDMTEYYDAVKNVWAAIPTDKSEAITKIHDYCGYYFKHLAINKTKTEEAIRRANITTINSESKIDVDDSTNISEKEEEIRVAEIIRSYSYADTAEAFVDKLISLNNTRPLTTKAIVFINAINQATINKLATLSSLQVIKFGNFRDYYTIPENFRPLILSDDRHMYLDVVKGRVGTLVDIPESIQNVDRDVY